MTRYIKELKPTTLSDVAAMIALYRPGPMEHISTFIDAKHGRVPVSYLHSDLEDILEETYGVIVYQDQVLHIAQKFAGYTLGEADIVRKAMGKKIPEIMAEEREKFPDRRQQAGLYAGAFRAGVLPSGAVRRIRLQQGPLGQLRPDLILDGLSQGQHIRRSHMVALLNSYVGHTDRITSAIAECQRLKIPVLPPSVTRGHTDFTIENQQDGGIAIRFGMGAVKNVGTASVDAVVESRKRLGGFESIEDMCRESEMAGVNRKTPGVSHQGRRVRRLWRPGRASRIDGQDNISVPERGEAARLQPVHHVRSFRRVGLGPSHDNFSAGRALDRS